MEDVIAIHSRLDGTMDDRCKGTAKWDMAFLQKHQQLFAQTIQFQESSKDTPQVLSVGELLRLSEKAVARQFCKYTPENLVAVHAALSAPDINLLLYSSGARCADCQTGVASLLAQTGRSHDIHQRRDDVRQVVKTVMTPQQKWAGEQIKKQKFTQGEEARSDHQQKETFALQMTTEKILAYLSEERPDLSSRDERVACCVDMLSPFWEKLLPDSAERDDPDVGVGLPKPPKI